MKGDASNKESRNRELPYFRGVMFDRKQTTSQEQKLLVDIGHSISSKFGSRPKDSIMRIKENYSRFSPLEVNQSKLWAEQAPSKIRQIGSLWMIICIISEELP